MTDARSGTLFRFWKHLGICAFLLPWAGYAQTMDIEALASRADAIVPVEVAFVPYGDMVLLGEALSGELVELSSSNELLGDCLPNKTRVRELAERHRNSRQGEIYSEAINRATYKVIAFLEHSGSGSKVICATGTHSTENWESDPRFPQWKARLDDLLRTGN